MFDGEPHKTCCFLLLHSRTRTDRKSNHKFYRFDSLPEIFYEAARTTELFRLVNLQNENEKSTVRDI